MGDECCFLCGDGQISGEEECDPGSTIGPYTYNPSPSNTCGTCNPDCTCFDEWIDGGCEEIAWDEYPFYYSEGYPPTTGICTGSFSTHQPEVCSTSTENIPTYELGQSPLDPRPGENIFWGAPYAEFYGYCVPGWGSFCPESSKSGYYMHREPYGEDIAWPYYTCGSFCGTVEQPDDEIEDWDPSDLWYWPGGRGWDCVREITSWCNIENPQSNDVNAYGLPCITDVCRKHIFDWGDAYGEYTELYAGEYGINPVSDIDGNPESESDLGSGDGGVQYPSIEECQLNCGCSEFFT